MKLTKYLFLILILTAYILSFTIDSNSTNMPILKQSKIYIDYNNTAFEDIKNKPFKKIEKEHLGFGYAPDFSIWIKLTLYNNDNKKVTKILEYANPLTTKVEFYDTNGTKIIDGMFNFNKNRFSINPIFLVSLNPKETKKYYIKASSKITTLIAKLQLYDKDSFFKKEIKKQFITAMFLGALLIIIIYNLVIYISTKDRAYLYYVLAIIGIAYHHTLYKGIANLYLLPNYLTIKSIEYATFVVAIPVVFLALFTKEILNIKRDTLSAKVINIFLIILPFWVFITYYFSINQYRSLYIVIFELALFIITVNAYFKHTRQALFLIFGWMVFFTSTLFMYLSSAGIYDVFITFPHFIEASLIVEAIAFSLALAYKINKTQKELIAQKESEKIRLEKLVDTKTKNLQNTLFEKELLFRELNHRVIDSLNSVSSFINYKLFGNKNIDTQKNLKDIQKQIIATIELYNIINRQQQVSEINVKEYFKDIIEYFKNSFNAKEIDISLNCSSDLKLSSKESIYCGIILIESLTNACKYAFGNSNNKQIKVLLTKQNNKYKLVIEDNGIGFNNKIKKESSGLSLIKIIADTQLDGELKIDSNNRVKIEITWDSL